MHPYSHGRHEYGQNFLTDPRVIARITNLVAATRGPIVEIGPGEGALTLPLQRTGRQLTAVEIHPPSARRLRSKLRAGNQVIQADFLDYRLSGEPGVIVGNLPFHLTTAILRKLLHSPRWTDAVLLTQWEVARRRAGIGGSSMMTAQWAAFYQFELHGRIPARAYTPAPSVDAGIITITRRSDPLVPWSQRKGYASFVHAVFTGSGHGMRNILKQVTGCTKAGGSQLCAAAGIRTDALPKQLSAEQWAALWRSAP